MNARAPTRAPSPARPRHPRARDVARPQTELDARACDGARVVVDGDDGDDRLACDVVVVEMDARRGETRDDDDDDDDEGFHAAARDDDDETRRARDDARGGGRGGG